jgi:hypothetical protein
MKTIKFNTIDNIGSVWEAEYLLENDGTLPDNGIILQNIKHAHYNYAKDVRVIGFWIEFESYENHRSVDTFPLFFPYRKAYFNFENASMEDKGAKFQMSKKRRIKKAETGILSNLFNSNDQGFDARAVAESLGAFNQYGFIDGLRAQTELKNNFETWGFRNCQYSSVEITQTYLFSKYSNNPSHEPTGGLTAARFFPLITYNFIENPIFDKSVKHFRVKSIRADIRMHNKLDTFIQSDILDASASHNQLLPTNDEVLKILREQPNQAGVFRDRDSMYMLLTGKFVDLFNPYDDWGASATRQIFQDMEKPLVYELIAKGLYKSSYILKDGEWGWDNIHWWGGYKQYHIPSAPGAFHAFHFHWRWSGTVYAAEMRLSYSPIFDGTFIDKPFKTGLESWEGVAPVAALVDPHIGYQSLEFAIVKNNKQLNLNKQITTTYNFKKMHTDVSSSPQRILDGDDIVLWLGIKVHQEIKLLTNNEMQEVSGLNGTILIQGMFFAHELEVYHLLYTGTKGRREYGRSGDDPNTIPKIWERYGGE